MKLLLISESPLEKIGDAYFAVDPWIRFPVHLAAHCERLTLLAPVFLKSPAQGPAKESWRLEPGSLRIVPHDPYQSFLGFFRLAVFRFFAWRKTIGRLIEEHDLVALRLPSPMISLVAGLAQKKVKPFVVFVAGDVEKQSDRVLESRYLANFLYSLAVRFWVSQEIRWCRTASIIYAYSQDLARRHQANAKAVRLVRTPHLTRAEFLHDHAICAAKTIRLLRVSWLLPSKGLEYLIEAVSLLAGKELDVRLELVGKERKTGYRSFLEQEAARFGIRDRITFSGWVPYDKMQATYRRNDIHVISSLAEGTPRVIVEGAARGLPLVCTAVGGAGDFLRHETDALLVPPADARALSEAIERLIRDVPLRKKLVENGYRMAEKYTFEELGSKIFNEMNAVIAAKGADTGE